MNSGEGAAVNQDTMSDWKTCLYNPIDIYNGDETGLYYKLIPDRSLMINKKEVNDI